MWSNHHSALMPIPGLDLIWEIIAGIHASPTLARLRGVGGKQDVDNPCCYRLGGEVTDLVAERFRPTASRPTDLP